MTAALPHVRLCTLGKGVPRTPGMPDCESPPYQQSQLMIVVSSSQKHCRQLCRAAVAISDPIIACLWVASCHDLRGFVDFLTRAVIANKAKQKDFFYCNTH